MDNQDNTDAPEQELPVEYTRPISAEMTFNTKTQEEDPWRSWVG